MTTFLYNILLTAGGDRMMETDPHGWTLTLISVTVVFTALIVLYFIYSFSGGLFSGKFKRAAARQRCLDSPANRIHAPRLPSHCPSPV